MDSVSNYVAQLMGQKLRDSGFIGDIKVSNVRANKAGYSAKAVLTKGVHQRAYKVSLANGKVVAKQNGPIRRYQNGVWS